MPRFTGRPTSSAWPISTYLGTSPTLPPAVLAERERQAAQRQAMMDYVFGPVLASLDAGQPATVTQRYALYLAGYWPSPAGPDPRDAALYVTPDGGVLDTYTEGGMAMAVPQGAVPVWSLDYPSPIPDGMAHRVWLDEFLAAGKAGRRMADWALAGPAAPAANGAAPANGDAAPAKPGGLNPLIFVGLGLKLLGVL
jgi:hypothetical protein